VSPGKVEVVIPAGACESGVHRFLAAKQDWVLAALKRLEAKAQGTQSLAPDFYGEGARIPFQGKTYPLSISSTTLKNIKIEFTGQFIAAVPEVLLSRDYSDEIRAALIRWFKRQAGVQAGQMVQKHTDRHQLRPRSIKIKTQKSRWGSCGIHNDISINWLLILAPREVFEYVVVHELCHIKVRNHSSAFWALVAAHLPAYQQQRRWLKEQGGSLMLGL